jgi:hypothetical protein
LKRLNHKEHEERKEHEDGSSPKNSFAASFFSFSTLFVSLCLRGKSLWFFFCLVPFVLFVLFVVCLSRPAYDLRTVMAKLALQSGLAHRAETFVAPGAAASTAASMPAAA